MEAQSNEIASIKPINNGIVESTAQSKLRPIHPQRLLPPLEVIRRMKEMEKTKVPKNKYLRFLKIFFGEGF